MGEHNHYMPHTDTLLSYHDGLDTQHNPLMVLVKWRLTGTQKLPEKYREEVSHTT